MDIEQDPRGIPSTARLNYTAYRFSRAMDRFAENLALAHGITLSQFLVLQVLAEGVPISNAQLARRTFVSAQAAHNVSNELIDAGLVERGDHPTNQRIRLVRLTEQGWSLIHTCYAELQQHEDQLAAKLGDVSSEQLVSMIDRAASALSGGYFGDDEAEAAAIAKRKITSRPRQVPSRLASSRLREQARG
ncbi:MAG TPA: MarR family transcriptional regulator [Enteractinococcus sp.]